MWKENHDFVSFKLSSLRKERSDNEGERRESSLPSLIFFPFYGAAGVS